MQQGMRATVWGEPLTTSDSGQLIIDLTPFSPRASVAVALRYWLHRLGDTLRQPEMSAELSEILLLAASPGAIDDGSEAVDLGQTPGDIVVLTAADTEIAALAAANRQRRTADPGAPSLRLANYLRLGHNMSVDLYVDEVLRHAKLVVCRLLGGRGYWPYGVDEIVAACRAADIPVAFLPGDDQPDAELAENVESRLIREAHAGRKRRVFALHEIHRLMPVKADAMP